MSWAMSTVTHDETALASTDRLGVGLLLAALAAVSFSISGSIATSLFVTGWTPGAVVLIRVGVAAVVLAPFGLRSMRGRVSAATLRRELPAVAGYGLLAVAASQFCYFSAVQHMEVAPAILVEYTAPAAVVVWLWLRHGQRPSVVTVVGAVVAALGLVLVLDVIGEGAGLSVVGVLWALGAMLGAATYFLLNAEGGIDLPPLALAWLGLVAGAVVLAVLGAVHLMPLQAATGSVTLAHAQVPWWAAILVLGVVTAALAYAAGIAAGRLLGARLASFVALFEVVSSVLFAWLLLGELPHLIQLVGGLLILAGVIAVKAGEPVVGAADPVDTVPLPAGEVASARPGL